MVREIHFSIFFLDFLASAIPSRRCHHLLTWVTSTCTAGHVRIQSEEILTGSSVSMKAQLHLMLCVCVTVSYTPQHHILPKGLCFDEAARIPHLLGCYKHFRSLVQWWQRILRYDCSSSEVVKMGNEMLWFLKTY